MENRFGGANSPLRENPQYRKHMETFLFLESRVDELESKRGYLSYEQTLELTKLKKLKLAERDSMRAIEDGLKERD